jgi:multidrug efflux pump subunit AcrA (membrane-fusion protein)
MHAGDEALEWPARFDRVREEIDLQTRTVRFVVAVDEPYANVVPGRRPPLAPGMFCDVELRGEPRPKRLVIPRVALHDGHVYLVDSDNRLERRRVEVDYAQGAIVSVTAGIAEGERVVISDPTPAIVGMLVEPLLDAEAHAQCLRDAAGEGSVR